MPPSKPHLQMSLEAALDEERREILEILEGRQPAQQQTQQRPQTTPNVPPVRSMLDIPSSPPPRHASVAGIGGLGASQPSGGRSPSIRSMLDVSPAPSPLRSTYTAASTPTSPVESHRIDKDHDHKHSTTAPRRASDSASNGFQKQNVGKRQQSVDFKQDYQFEMLPSIPSHALPKRVTQGGKKLSISSTGSSSSGVGGGGLHPNSMATAMSGAEFGPLPGSSRGRDYGGARHSFSRHSKSPSARMGRSRSPGGTLLNSNSFNPMPTPGTFVTDSGKVINLEHAYRRLSTAALSRSSGSLGQLSKRPSTSRERGESVDSLFDADARLAKDYYSDTQTGGNYSSDEVDDTSSGEDEGWKSDTSSRGRRRKRKTSEAESTENDGKESPKVRSLLAAAEEERKSVSYKVRSLLDPPVVEKIVNKKTGVHPHTSFDYAGSAGNTPAGSEDEAEFCDIKKAQNLSIYMSPVDQTVPNRVIRTIIRGDFTQIQEEAQKGHGRLRKYLVATDLSEEAVYALEWTIGTILRDGDTLYAIYAVDEDAGTGKGGDLETPSSPLHISDGTRAVHDIAATVGSQTEQTAGNVATTFPQSRLSQVSAGGSESKPGSTDSRAMSKTDAERLHAIENISQTCIRLLRKTRLQVRVAVEVIHCKTPKHLITEAIDGLEPTLVILGSRGRSALKGVLLGSFSNYLVTKSSVPVMVARKKLKKHTKFKASNVRLSNNLTTPKKLAQAKID